MKQNEFICADAAEAMSGLPDACVDLIVADPPYNLGKNYGNNLDAKEWSEYEQFTKTWLAQAVRILKPTGSIYTFMGVRFVSHLFLILETDLKLQFNGWITWHYTQGMGRKTGFSSRHEDILYFTRSDRYTFNLDDIRIPQKYYRERNNMSGANPGDVWEFSHVHYSNPEREAHPTQKPEALLERIIRASSNRGDLVLDPFVGSGTTCKVAKALDRNWIGIDINPDYIAMSKARLAAPFDQFDSFDTRTERVPKDLPKQKNNGDSLSGQMELLIDDPNP